MAQAKPTPIKYTMEFLYRPGRTLDDLGVERLAGELDDVASRCFEDVPRYNCLVGDRACLDDKVIILARRPSGELAGFCSAVLLDVPQMAPVMHFGLTCVHPDDRGQRLTHKLITKLMVTYMLRYRPIGKIWVSNVACVLSSIGNVAAFFDNVYPSPYLAEPAEEHLRVAQAISERYREAIFIHDDALFDAEAFVFRGSVDATVFQKDGDDDQYYHRDRLLNTWYRDLLDFDRGDEVVQVGSYSVATFLRYIKNGRKRSDRPVVRPAPPVGTRPQRSADAA